MRIITLIGAMLLSLTAVAQDYRPMVEDGKAWLGKGSENHIYDDILWLFVSGDTVIGGHQAKKVYLKEDGQVSYRCALYETGKKVYSIRRSQEQPQLVFDFSISQLGEKVVYGETTLEYVGADFITVGNERFRRLHLKVVETLNPRLWPLDTEVVWVEGVGGNVMIYEPFYRYVVPIMKLLSCRVGDRDVFTDVDFARMADSPAPNILPLLEEGKRWTYQSADGTLTHYTIAGDTLYNGLVHKKLYASTDNGQPRLASLLVETAGIVFRTNDHINCNYAVYDFSGNNFSWWRLLVVDSNIKECSRNRVMLNGTERTMTGYRRTYGSDTCSVVLYWVEGIGASCDLLSSQEVMPKAWLVSCELDGMTLFDGNDFGLSAYVKTDDTKRLPYHPLLKEGKQWIYDYHHVKAKENHSSGSYKDNFEETLEDCTYTLRGDTVIGGEKAFKMYAEMNGISRYHGAWIEKDSCVYFIYQADTKKNLFYRFGLKQDELFSSNEYLNRLDTLVYDDIQLNYYHFNTTNRELNVFNWIEGVGHDKEGIIYPYRNYNFGADCFCDYQTFKSCIEDGIVIYSVKNDVPTGIERKKQTTAPNTDNTVYDLQGRRLKGLPKKGIYVESGKKHIVK